METAMAPSANARDLKDSASPRAPRVRGAAALLLGIVAIVSVPLAVIGAWTNSVIFDGTAIAEVTVETVSDPEVAEAFGERLAEVATEVVDTLVPGELPEVFDEVVGRELTGLLQRGVLDDALTAVILDAHELAVAVIEGEDPTPSVSVSGGDVAINLLPLVTTGLEVAERLGLLGEAEVPFLDPRAPHEEHIRQLETSWGVDLDDDTGLVVVYSSDAVAEAESWVNLARRIVEAARRLVMLVSIVAVLSIGGALLASTRRSRLGLVLAVAIAATGGLVILVGSRLPEPMGSLLVDPVWAVALEDACRRLIDRLQTRILLMIVVCVLVAFASVVASGAMRRPRGSPEGHPRVVDRVEPIPDRS